MKEVSTTESREVRIKKKTKEVGERQKKRGGETERHREIQTETEMETGRGSIVSAMCA